MTLKFLSLAILFSVGTSAYAIQEMDITQFGHPKDANFIFCEGADCQGRTVKHFALPKPAPKLPVKIGPHKEFQPVVTPLQLPAGEKIEPVKVIEPELSHAKVEEAVKLQPKKKAKPRAKRKAPVKAEQPECLPAGK